MAVRDVVQAAAGQGGDDKLYVEDVFSTYLYTGIGAPTQQTITNGIDLANEGGLVWTKPRNTGTYNYHVLVDTVRGENNRLFLPSAIGQDFSGSINNFSSTGFDVSGVDTNDASQNYASWTFRKAPKFFDVVTYTGTGTARTVSHNLGSVPGTIIVKVTDNAGGWQVYHRSTGATEYLVLNETQAAGTSSNQWNNTAPTDSVFTVGNIDTNESGRTYVAYLFAHNAGGFGDDAQQNVISCGSYTEGASAQDITLGYEPQWLLMKRTNGASDWYLYDTMRGMGYTDSNALVLNTSDPEAVFGNGFFRPTATGFTALPSYWGSGASVIYIAIRRPMKTPESGTSVFTPDLANAAVAPLWEAPFPVDLGMYAKRDNSTATFYAGTRLTGTGRLSTWGTAAEVTDNGFKWDYMNGWFNNAFTDSQYLGYSFRRAPGFMDVVCYDSNGVAGTQIPHNLGVKPQLMLVKCRNNAVRGVVYAEPLGATQYLVLNTDTFANISSDPWNNTEPTASVFTVDDGTQSNAGYGYTYVAYLFSTLPGVSKVGSYTGTGADLNVDCGFSAGARFILIKRTDASGDWYVWDSARGIVAGNDPYLLLNSTAAEVTSTDYIDPLSSGFTVTSNASSTVNVDTGTYIFLAIA